MLIADRPSLSRQVLLIGSLSMQALAFWAYFFPITSLIFLQENKGFFSNLKSVCFFGSAQVL